MEKISFEADPKTPELTEKDISGHFASAINHDLSSELKNEERVPSTKWRKMFKSLQIAVMATVAATTINYEYQFRQKVSESDEKDGIKWSHEDKETEHILNTLSGKENFSDEEKIHLMRYMTLKWCKEKSIKVPEEIKNWGMSDIERFYETLPKETAAMLEFKYQKDWVLQNPIILNHVNDELWRIEKACGSPYIRWEDPDHSFIFSDSLGNKDEHRAHYNSINNTIYLAPEHLSPRIYDQFVAESGHADQFADAPITSFATVIKNISQAGVNAITHGSTFAAEWDKLYTIPDTIEYDAHEIREKKLDAEVKKAENADVKKLMENSHIQPREH